ncbi:uncharacterized protein LOC131009702 [Salvia miltiorrhiza]|uniref:uncharacterized protein LOC131009702 n=1 Tax=Salvia miltiorrhiza TaxID=226208 RepID=UPI0025AD5C3A|nr:uncharacterized protein LOC131009702 [Salvia miltiorrhiza]
MYETRISTLEERLLKADEDRAAAITAQKAAYEAERAACEAIEQRMAQFEEILRRSGQLPSAALLRIEDGWNWTAAPDGKYTTRSSYIAIKSRRSDCQSQNADAKSLASVWTTPAPHKAFVTLWRILRNRLPTCDNLSKRNTSLGDEERECPHCHEHGESTNHLFTSCAKTQEIWDEIQKWIGIILARPCTIGLHWKMFCYCGKNKKVTKLLRMIWVGCCWILWKKWNDKKFEGKDWEVKDLILELKARTWCWNRMFGVLDKDLDFSLWSYDDLIFRSV